LSQNPHHDFIGKGERPSRPGKLLLDEDSFLREEDGLHLSDDFPLPALDKMELHPIFMGVFVVAEDFAHDPNGRRESLGEDGLDAGVKLRDGEVLGPFPFALLIEIFRGPVEGETLGFQKFHHGNHMVLGTFQQRSMGSHWRSGRARTSWRSRSS